MSEDIKSHEQTQGMKLIPISREAHRLAEKRIEGVRSSGQDLLDFQIQTVLANKKFFAHASSIFQIRYSDTTEIENTANDPRFNYYMTGLYFFFLDLQSEAEQKGKAVPEINIEVLEEFTLQALKDERAQQSFRAHRELVRRVQQEAEEKGIDLARLLFRKNLDPEFRELFGRLSQDFMPALDEELTRRIGLFDKDEPFIYKDVEKFKERTSAQNYRVILSGFVDAHYLVEAFYSRQRAV